jgi:hypothetical protein
MLFLEMTKTSNLCSVCQKQLGTSYCTGCGVYFCTKDFKSHRGVLFNEMDTLIAHRNDLQEKITRAIQYSESHSPLMTKIDEWQKMMMEKVKIVADHTRKHVIELLNLKRVRLDDDFQRFSEELFDLKQTENFVEHDLSRFKYMVYQFNQELKQINKPITITLHTEVSDRLVWSRLIYAEEKSTYARIQQQQQQKQDEGKIIN